MKHVATLVTVLGFSLAAIAVSCSSTTNGRLGTTAGAGGDESSGNGNGNVVVGNGNGTQQATGVGGGNTGFGGMSTTDGGACSMGGESCVVFSDCCSGTCENLLCTDSNATATASSSSGGACSMTCVGFLESNGAESLCEGAPASAFDAYNAIASCVCDPANCGVQCALTCAMEAETNPDCATCEQTTVEGACATEAQACSAN